MLIALHKRARTTPAVRAEIAESREPVAVLARRYNVSEATIRKWRARRLPRSPHCPSPANHAHARLRRQSRSICVAACFVSGRPVGRDARVCLPERVALRLRPLSAPARGGQSAQAPAAPREGRSQAVQGLPARLPAHGRQIPALEADETGRSYLFVAIDRATRWVYIAIHPNKSAASARAFLKALAKACPIKITRLLTENEPQAKFQRSYNGKEFTDRLFGARGREPSGEHEFDQLCQALGIKHRLTKRRAPQTNGVVERFNGRISDILKDPSLLYLGEDLRATLHRYVDLYNHQLPQAALGGKTPLEAMKEWFKSNPELFHRRPYDRPGCDT